MTAVALPDYSEALRQALRVADEGVRELGEERVALALAAGRLLREPVLADRDLPPFNRAMMDGYALRAADFARGRALPVAGEIPAGAPAALRVPAGAAVKIATGAPLPDDCDTVIQHEASDRGNPVRFTIDRVEKGNAVHARGADARRGDILIAAGTILAAHHLGIAASAGASVLRVRSKPQAWVLTSGDEVAPADTPIAALQSHQIRNSNSVMLSELLRRFGGEPVKLQHLRDDRDATVNAVRAAIEPGACHLLVTVGGVSAGERDHFPAAFEACGVQRFLAGASIQPGRPIVVGRGPPPTGAIVLALPGNPVSVLACACLFAWPIVRAMLGLAADLPWRTVELAESVKPNPHRRAFRPAILRDGSVSVPSWAGSGDLSHTAPTHGLVELPVQSEPVPAGTRLRFLPWP